MVGLLGGQAGQPQCGDRRFQGTVQVVDIPLSQKHVRRVGKDPLGVGVSWMVRRSSRESWAELPIMTKDDLVSPRDDIVTVGR